MVRVQIIKTSKGMKEAFSMHLWKIYDCHKVKVCKRYTYYSIYAKNNYHGGMTELRLNNEDCIELPKQ